ncbi:ROK family transcriptional regulator [Nonomuraea endophytica]|uniref:Putative NBD/HSP70 family sugar kinase n=1 Tax=Nonomuraea endophytica TaxID=714136 RepID=A0A7W8EHC4_9ACTN|nr:ROK family transcriptional regulator [Nonomuraea endophytica]MBB5079403.1 putative NBD/HSP70 family sugar kinase [Nonomuraea endophytica]
MRAINERIALRVLLERGPLTRPELGEFTGLSKPTAFQLLARLQTAGLVVSDGMRSGQAGRNAETYRINPAAAHVAAMGVTPDAIEVRVADITGTAVGEFVLPTPEPVNGSPAERLRAALAGAAPPGPLSRVVIGVRAAVDPATGRLGHVAEADMPGWRLPGLVPTLSAALGAEVSVENDVNLVALAEQARGAAAGCPDFVLLWADDGLGAAMVIGGRLHRGFFGAAGEICHMPISGTVTARDGGEHGSHGFQSVGGGGAIRDLLSTYGIDRPDFRQSVRAAVAMAGESGRAAQDASAGLRVVAGRLAVGLAAIASVVDPGLIVLAGGVMEAGGERLRDLVERELHVLLPTRPAVRGSELAGNPVLAGAMDLALATVRDDLFGR